MTAEKTSRMTDSNSTALRVVLADMHRAADDAMVAYYVAEDYLGPFQDAPEKLAMERARKAASVACAVLGQWVAYGEEDPAVALRREGSRENHPDFRNLLYGAASTFEAVRAAAR